MTLIDGLLVLVTLTMLVAIGRIVVGPTGADRTLGVDLGFATFIAALAVLAVRLDAPELLDLVLASTLLGFLSTVSFAYLVERRPR